MMEKKRIILIFPNIALGTATITRAMHKFFPPSHFMHLGIAYLASALEREGHDVKIIDATVERLSHKMLEPQVMKFAPDIIGVTANVANASVAIETCIYCKQACPSAMILLGGPWATINWKYVVKNGYADVVVIGEGEETIVELSRMLPDNEREMLATIKGIAFKSNDGIVIKTASRSFIENLDALPFPAWHLFPDPRKYNFPFKASIAYPIITSRGCPFNCNFCTKYVHGYRIRARSVESVIAEFRHLKDTLHANEIYIVDDNFTMDVDRSSRILDRMIEEKFNFTITLSNGVRADTLTPDLLQKMKRAGIVEFSIGVEAGNQEVLNKIGKSLSLKKVREIAPKIHELGFILKCFFILGHPFDTPGTMMETIKLAIELDPDISQFSKATPWPGTRLYDLVKKNGEFTKKMNVISSVNLYASQFKIWAITPRLVNKYFILAYILFYVRLSEIISFIRKLKTIAQLKWYLTNVVLFLLRFLGH
ncbi:MAG TPA: radical SAM protein [Candidatus Lokiarchaeia archaeon]|nr:radical SAM protein [Candidatus Lokiarchaeia archaeon]